MFKAIAYNLRNLANFAGRDARQTFWYYVLFLVVMQFVISIVASIPMYVSMVGAIFDSASQGVDPDIAAQAMVAEMIGPIRTQAIIGMVIGAIGTAMIVAAFVRRLHDGGFSGWIALVPVATQIFSIAYSFTTLDQIEELMMQNVSTMAEGGGDPLAMQAEVGWYGLVGWIGYIVVIIFGVLPSNDGPNRYGEEPVGF